MKSEAFAQALCPSCIVKPPKEERFGDCVKCHDHYFETIQQRIRWIEATRLSSQEEAHLQDLKRFAAKAWRSPLTTSDNKEIDDFYLRLRTADGRRTRMRWRDSISSILLSPRFCFRTDAAAIELGSNEIELMRNHRDESHSIPDHCR